MLSLLYFVQTFVLTWTQSNLCKDGIYPMTYGRGSNDLVSSQASATSFYPSCLCHAHDEPGSFYVAGKEVNHNDGSEKGVLVYFLGDQEAARRK